MVQSFEKSKHVVDIMEWPMIDSEEEEKSISPARKEANKINSRKKLSILLRFL